VISENAPRVTHWLLLRGLSREQRHWWSFPEELERATGARTLCLDLPGFGTEHARVSPRTIARITDDVRRRFDPARSASDRWGIVGVSLGGMVALDWCARHPNDFAACVTINTSARPSWPLERFRLVGLRALAGSFTTDPVAKERVVLAITSNKLATDLDEIAKTQARWALERTPSRASLASQLRAATVFKVPASVNVPLLVLASKTDRLVSHRCSERIAARLGAKLVLHDRGGHDLPLDEPAFLCREIATWVAMPESDELSDAR
jgi:pimeloyl-ACP methyl ester carboxylesterase